MRAKSYFFILYLGMGIVLMNELNFQNELNFENELNFSWTKNFWKNDIFTDRTVLLNERFYWEN